MGKSVKKYRSAINQAAFYSKFGDMVMKELTYFVLFIGFFNGIIFGSFSVGIWSFIVALFVVPFFASVWRLYWTLVVPLGLVWASPFIFLGYLTGISGFYGLAIITFIISLVFHYYGYVYIQDLGRK